MKSSLIIILSVTIGSYTNLLCAQQKSNPFLTVKDLVGVWQKGSSRLGDELNQNFIFTNTSNFIFNNGKHEDDVVSTVKLKGKYRLVKDKIYFTITSKVIIDDAKIGIVDPMLDFGIFEYTNCAFKEIKESNPKEIGDPANITLLKANYIKINNEDYYKVYSNPKDINKL